MWKLKQVGEVFVLELEDEEGGERIFLTKEQLDSLTLFLGSSGVPTDSETGTL